MHHITSFWKSHKFSGKGHSPFPDPTPFAAYSASILTSSALDLRPPNVPVALTPMLRTSSYTVKICPTSKRTIELLLILVLHPFYGLFSRTTWVSRYQNGKTILDLNEARDYGVLGWQWHQLDHMQTMCTLLQTDNHISISSLKFYRPDALSDVQSTTSKYWRQRPREQ